MDVIGLVRTAGVVGAGGAGFPTHVKLNAKAEYVIANGAECEPLLRVDRILMANNAERIVRGMEAAMSAVGADKGVVATKEHYHAAVKALEGALKDHPKIRLHVMKNTYPLGDEKALIHEITGRVVAADELPKDSLCVVCNVTTLVNIAGALEGIPVTRKYVTIGGEVERPVTVSVPVGTPFRELARYGGIKGGEKDHALIRGGPCMGTLEEDWDAVVTKTTGGLLFFKWDHPLIVRRKIPIGRQLKLAQAVCCQCSQCTQLCPRHTLGLGVEPHKAMRAAAGGDAKLLGNINGILSCCNCGLCTHYACPMGLTPSVIMNIFREGLLKQGVRPSKSPGPVKAEPDFALKRIPVSRLIARMALGSFDVDAPLDEKPFMPKKVRIPLRMHTGAPSVPVVSVGAEVNEGRKIAVIPENALGAEIHASIDGKVTGVNSNYIEITGREA
ncbi:MAG: 4Fe-4S dicluster domain-containing protein [Treponema sp.]|nr:4Fe-4S dicluster domain-containing protein [Treponema sp.]